MLAAFDPASRTGWALTPEERVRVETGSWQTPTGKGVAIHERCADLYRQIAGFLSRQEISYAALEVPSMAPPRKVKRFDKMLGEEVDASTGDVKTQAILWAIHGTLVAALTVHNIPFRTVMPATWRRDMFGKGHGMTGAQVKHHCKEELERQGFRVPNLDAAEAGILAIWLRHRVERFRLEDQQRLRGGRSNAANTPREAGRPRQADGAP